LLGWPIPYAHPPGETNYNLSQPLPELSPDKT
jgi:hypothetical protein